jgi:hypothetical protein
VTILKRVPLWGAIIILVILILVAIGGDTDSYSIDQEKIWTIIGINFVLILIPLAKRFFSGD